MSLPNQYHFDQIVSQQAISRVVRNPESRDCGTPAAAKRRNAPFFSPTDRRIAAHCCRSLLALLFGRIMPSLPLSLSIARLIDICYKDNSLSHCAACNTAGCSTQLILSRGLMSAKCDPTLQRAEVATEYLETGYVKHGSQSLVIIAPRNAILKHPAGAEYYSLSSSINPNQIARASRWFSQIASAAATASQCACLCWPSPTVRPRPPSASCSNDAKSSDRRR